MRAVSEDRGGCDRRVSKLSHAGDARDAERKLDPSATAPEGRGDAREFRVVDLSVRPRCLDLKRAKLMAFKYLAQKCLLS